MRLAALVEAVLAHRLLVFVLLARAYVDGGLVVSFDDNVSRWVADTVPGWIESVARVVTWLGGAIGAGVVTAVALVVLWRADRRADAVFLAAAVVGITVLVPILKAVYERARPDLGSRSPLPHSYSFPSGHAATAVVLYGALGLLARRARELAPARGRVARRGCAPGARDRHEPRAAQRALRQRRRRRLRRGARLALLLRDRAGRDRSAQARGDGVGLYARVSSGCRAHS